MMWKTIIIALAVAVAVQAQAPPFFSVPSAGESGYALRLKAGYVPQGTPAVINNRNVLIYNSTELDKEGSQRYASAKQTAGEWDALGSSYSIEFWLNADVPRSDPTGAWPVPPPSDEPQFQVLFNRHPGAGSPNENSHFHFQLTRGTLGMAMVFWAGCGCVNRTNPASCGFGYLLNSDSRGLANADKKYIIPGRWTHVAVVIDGDDLSTGLQTKIGRLYMDGKLQFSNVWADGGPTGLNRAGFKQIDLCKKGGVTVRGVGDFDSVTFGKHSNQDATALRPSLEYGFNGMLDEIRFWKGLRSPLQIATWWNVALPNAAAIPRPFPSLVAYFRFNEPTSSLNVNQDSFVNLLNTNTEGLVSVKNIIEFPVGDVFRENGNNSLGRVITVLGANLLLPQTFPVVNVKYVTQIFFEGSNGGNYPLKFTLTGFSPALGALLTSKTVLLLSAAPNPLTNQTRSFEPSTLDPPAIFAGRGEALGVADLLIRVNCADAQCSPFGGKPQEHWLEYQASNDTTVGTTARIYFDFRADCETKVDACGVCGGDNRDCQCVWYRDFRNARMAHVLFLWSRNLIVQQIDCATDALQRSLTIVRAPGWTLSPSVGETLIAKLNFMMNFYDGCLGPYCSAVSEFVEVVRQYVVNSTGVAIPYP